MKAWTLFFVILFLSIYGQRHISTRCITSNGFLQKSAKAIVKNDHDFMWMLTEAAQNRIYRFPLFQNNQKLTTITTGTGIEISANMRFKCRYSKETIVKTTPIKNFI